MPFTSSPDVGATRRDCVSSDSRTAFSETRTRVHRALSAWPEPEARKELVHLATSPDLRQLDAVGYALARCGRARRRAAGEVLSFYEGDRRVGLRTIVLYARSYLLEDDPRQFVREMRRVASLPGKKPWVSLMEELHRMWKRDPERMFGLMTPWLTHRDPWRRWAALHGLEHPGRLQPRSVLKVLRLLRGERDARVRRLLGHVIGQGIYPYHPREALEEMARWLADGAEAAPAVARRIEDQVGVWFRTGMGTMTQKRRLAAASREYLAHKDPLVRAHARRLARALQA